MKQQNFTKTYTKQAIIKSKSFAKYRDLLFVLLENDKLYSKEDTNKLIDDYLKRSVN